MNAFTRLLARMRSLVQFDADTHPRRDWLFVMGVTGILFLLSAGWSYWLFIQVNQGEQSGSVTASSTPVNGQSVNIVRQVFDTRAAERAHYQNDYRFVDPSR